MKETEEQWQPNVIHALTWISPLVGTLSRWLTKTVCLTKAQQPLRKAETYMQG